MINPKTGHHKRLMSSIQTVHDALKGVDSADEVLTGVVRVESADQSREICECGLRAKITYLLQRDYTEEEILAFVEPSPDKKNHES